MSTGDNTSEYVYVDESSYRSFYPPCFVRKCDNCPYKDQCGNFSPSDPIITCGVTYTASG